MLRSNQGAVRELSHWLAAAALLQFRPEEVKIFGPGESRAVFILESTR
jgi:hypothetical protein